MLFHWPDRDTADRLAYQAVSTIKIAGADWSDGVPLAEKDRERNKLVATEAVRQLLREIGMGEVVTEWDRVCKPSADRPQRDHQDGTPDISPYRDVDDETASTFVGGA